MENIVIQMEKRIEILEKKVDELIKLQSLTLEALKNLSKAMNSTAIQELE